MNRIFTLKLFVLCLLVIFLGSSIATGAEKIKIGVVGPLSGAGAAYGIHQERGVKLAAKQINRKGGIHGREIEIISVDNEGKPQTSVAVMKKLVYSDKVMAAIGSVYSSIVLADMQVTKEAKVPQVTAITSAPAITEQGNEWIFRTQVRSDYESRALVNLAKEFRIKTWAVLNQNDDYGRASADEFIKSMEKLPDFKIVAHEVFQPADQDFKAQLLKINKSGATALGLFAFLKPAALVVKQAQSLGMNLKIFGNDAIAVLEYIDLVGKAAAEGNIALSLFVPDNPDPKVQKFNEAYKAEYKELPNKDDALGYDAMMVLAKAMEELKPNFTTTELKDGLEKVDYDGVTAHIKFDKKHDGITELLVVEVKNGVWVLRSQVKF